MVSIARSRAVIIGVHTTTGYNSTGGLNYKKKLYYAENKKNIVRKLYVRTNRRLIKDRVVVRLRFV